MDFILHCCSNEACDYAEGFATDSSSFSWECPTCGQDNVSLND